jgi:AcrR family transcriptional regulator
LFSLVAAGPKPRLAVAPGLITPICVIKVQTARAVKGQTTQVCVQMPRSEKTDMKERILQTADRLFYLRGIRAVGVDTVAAEIGISKRTLYNHFPSKDALIRAYLERRFIQAPASDKPPLEQILGTFDRLERGFASKSFRGCPFVNAVAELGAEDRAVKKIAIAFKESRRLWFRDLLLRLDVPDAEGLATQLTLLVDGSIAQDLVRDDPSMARAAKQAATVLLANAGVEVGGDATEKSSSSTDRRPPASS